MGVEGAERGDTNDWRALQGTDTFFCNKLKRAVDSPLPLAGLSFIPFSAMCSSASLEKCLDPHCFQAGYEQLL